MRRHRAHYPADENPQEDGDDGFVGVRNDDHPAIIPPGFAYLAENCRFTFMEAEPRLGVAKLVWSNRVSPSSDFPYPLGVIYGAIGFRDPNEVEWMIIAAAGKVYRTREGNAAVEINLPTGIIIDQDVQFEQTFDGVVMFRGPDLDELIMDDLDQGFKFVTSKTNVIGPAAGTENPIDGTEGIPRANNGEWVGNRLFIPFSDPALGNDLLAVSDYMNVTRFQPVRSQARINQGSSDRLLRFFKFSETTGIAFKEESVYALYNTQGDLSTMTLDSVSNQMGLAGAYAVAQVGEDQDQKVDQVWFLSNRKGIFQLRVGDNGRVQVGSVPVSKPIQKYINRIDWSNASLARAAYFDNKFYMAVPLDGAEQWVKVKIGTWGDDEIYFPAAQKDVPTVPGTEYRWVPGENEDSLTNGTEVLTVAGSFTAQGVKVVIRGAGGQAITGTVEKNIGPCNNALLVFDFIRNQWAGIDTGPSICVKEFLTHTYVGARRLFYVSVDGFINLMEELFFDEDNVIGAEDFPLNVVYNSGGEAAWPVTKGATYYFKLGANDTTVVNGTEILTSNGLFTAQLDSVTLKGVPLQSDTLEIVIEVHELETGWINYDWVTRGYRCGNNGRKRFKRMEVTGRLWNPVLNVNSINDGQLEEVPVIEGLTKSPALYDRPAWATAWDETNVNDDHATKHRQDYSVTLSQVKLNSLSGRVVGQRYYVEELIGLGGIFYDGVYVPHGSYFTHDDASELAWDDESDSNFTGFWKLEEETSATNYVGLGAGGNDLTQTGSVEQAAGKVAGTFAARFQVGDKLAVADVAGVKPGGSADWHWGGWFYFDDVSTNQQLMGKGIYASGTEEYGLILEGGTKQLKAYVNNGASQTVVNSAVTPIAGQWYLIQCHWDSSDVVTIRVDDAVRVSAAHTLGIPSNSNDFQIGESGGTYDFKGRADEVFLWKRLSATAPANDNLQDAMWNSGAGVTIPGTSAPPVSVYPGGSYVIVGDNGIEPERHQDWQENRRIPHSSRGKYIQLRISTTQGRASIQNTYVDAHSVNRNAGSKE